jgi:hypothetical protein
VTDAHVIAGKARLPIELVGTVTSAAGEDARLERGQRLDSRAYLVIRGWIDPVVHVELLDPNDPAPYWLVSTRHPDRVIAAIETAKATLRTPGK